MPEPSNLAQPLQELDSKTITTWKRLLHEEVDAGFLYRALARQDFTGEQKKIFQDLARVEDRHGNLLLKLFEDHNIQVALPAPSWRAQFFAWVAQRFGGQYLVSMLVRKESREVKGFLTLGKSNPGEYFQEVTHTLAKESMEHTLALRQITGEQEEPWHQTKSGGLLRNIVYGFNDGLTANFGLFAGVIGAAVEPRIVLLSGFAGMLSDSLSMGSSGYLAAKSEQEVYSHEIALEREEIALMPEMEEEELRLIYEAKGIEKSRAQVLAKEVMSDPGRALQEKVREELGITQAYATPLRQGVITGTATAIGAFIPIAPFLLLGGQTGIWVSFAISMLSHFGVGAGRSIFTGRGIIRSGIDMFLVGLGVAVAGYYLGEILVKILR